MKRVIINTADDLGLSEETNLAIERAYGHGALSTASLMMGQPGTQHALVVLRRNPGLLVGWHFHACDSRPLTCKRWPWGRSAAVAGLALAVWPAARALIRRELSEQWKQFEAAGLKASVVNSHHHLHIHPFIAREMARTISGSFSGLVRGFEVRFLSPDQRPSLAYRILRRKAVDWLRDWPTDRRTDSLWGLDRTFRMSASEVIKAQHTLACGHHEFLFHPRRENDMDQRALLELRNHRDLLGNEG